jgi:hypothetical protein
LEVTGYGGARFEVSGYGVVSMIWELPGGLGTLGSWFLVWASKGPGVFVFDSGHAVCSHRGLGSMVESFHGSVPGFRDKGKGCQHKFGYPGLMVVRV